MGKVSSMEKHSKGTEHWPHQAKRWQEIIKPDNSGYTGTNVPAGYICNGTYILMPEIQD